MKNDIVDACGLPANDKVYLKKDSCSEGGWRTVYPWKDKEGNWLWKNVILGGSQNLFWIIFIILLIFGFIYVYNHDTAEMQKVVQNPCAYCSSTLADNYLIENDILERQTG